MSLQTLSEWLRCPNCFLPLHPAGALLLTCTGGHSFDVNKRGFVNLLSGRRKFIGDSAAMLDARDAFLAAGWYEELQQHVCRVIAGENPSRLLDIGCGTGYYLRAALPAEASVRALGVDLSPVAVSRGAQGQDRIDGLVADVWSPLPIRDGATDVILNIFAPRNAAEFHRVLQPHGLLLVVVPQPEHLKELRAAGLAVDIQADKVAHLTSSLSSWFTIERHEMLERTVLLSAPEVALVIGMGPSSHHAPSSIPALPDPGDGADPLTNLDTTVPTPVTQSVTFAFDVLEFRRR